jgi:hypothetical protein
MKRFIIFILSSILIIFSFFYNKRIDSIHLYSILSERFIDLSKDSFDIDIYVTNKDSVYSNLNYIDTYFKQNNNEILKTNILNITYQGLDNDLYHYVYKIQTDKSLKGIYNNLRLEIKSFDTKTSINLGNYYFYYLEKSDELNIDKNINSLGNINNISFKLNKDLINKDYCLLNGLNKKVTPNIDLTNSYINIDINCALEYFNKSLLINYNNEYFIIENNEFNKNYLCEAIYD